MSAQYYVVSGSRVDRVDSAIPERVRLNLPNRHQRQRSGSQSVAILIGRRDLSAVSNYQVVSTCNRDGIAKTSADHDVIAAAGIDQIGPSSRGCRKTRYHINVRGIRFGSGYRSVAFLADVINRRVIARNNVVPFSTVDCVLIVSAQHQIVSHSDCDCVLSSNSKGRSLDPAQRHCLTRIPVQVLGCRCDLAAVSNHQIVPIPGCNRVSRLASQNDV